LFGPILHGLGLEKPTRPKSTSFKKPTGPKSPQKPCGIGLAHGPFFRKKNYSKYKKNGNN